jgi:NTP pyrophosphatase (non-canonical NTP hydrolase)
MNLTGLSKEIHETAKSKGFYDKERNFGEIIALIHSEVSEILEADRKQKWSNINYHKELFERKEENYKTGLDRTETPEKYFKRLFEGEIKNTIPQEIADSIIRLLDLAGFLGIDIQSHVEIGMRYNKLREKMHGKKY